MAGSEHIGTQPDVTLIIELKTYAAKHEGDYPPALSTLVKEGVLLDAKLIEHTNSKTKQTMPWLYNRHLTAASPDRAYVIASPVVSEGGKRWVMRNDGSGTMIAEEAFQKLSGFEQ